MRERGVSPTLYTYNIMMKHLFRLKQIFNLENKPFAIIGVDINSKFIHNNNKA